ncbi:hypothetical protein PVK06_018646 [Gossypium arboreum]|uniref:Uncharacterized protein n=1 Tax=Gossypium arboreum TaxID=29729 RepID=A0ABR0PHI7_GOSAR|nr:hypothetical protein PVK06_018646 [Gossypium arboreum]
MKKVAKDLDQVAEEWLREHKEKRAENVANSEEDFMGVLLSVLSDTEEHEADTINKATSLVKQELDIHVGKDKLLLIESDTKNLVYLQSVIKKTLRLYPAAPLSVTHEAIEDCSVSGYHVSAGETVDMRESPGLTNPKATPLEVHITPRLPTFVYQSTN